MRYSDKTFVVIKPSQWINLGWYLVGIGGTLVLLPLGPAAGVPLLIFLWKVLEVYFWRYEFGEETIVERKGVLNVQRNEIHYYRIKSIQVEEPLLYRIVGISKVHVITSDKFTSTFTFVGVPDGQKIRSVLREMVAGHRGEKGVKEFDLYDM